MWAAHSHTDYDTSGRVARAWTARNSSNTTKVFDTSYCHATYVAGQPCGTGADSGVLKYTVDNLSVARSDYTYSSSNRLTDVTNFGGHTYHYDYDTDGNRTTVKLDGTTTQTRTFNSGNQISSTGYGYDAAGNLTTDPTAGTLVYNGAGQMTAQTGLLNGTYSYAGADQTELTHQTVPGGTTFDYTYGRSDQNKQPILESFAKNAATYYCDHDSTGTPLAIHLPSGVHDFYVLDGHGSVVGLINAAGTSTATYTYDPYGTQLTGTGAGDIVGPNPLRYAAGLTERGTGWTKYGIRYNDTTVGRFTAQDPLTRLLNPDNGNRYAYAADDPINNIDPTGKDISGIEIGFGLVLAGAFTGFIGGIALAGIGIASEVIGAVAIGAILLGGVVAIVGTVIILATYDW